MSPPFQNTNGECQLESSAAMLVNTIEQVAVSYKPLIPRTAAGQAAENRIFKKSVAERDEEYEKLRQLLSFDDVSGFKLKYKLENIVCLKKNKIGAKASAVQPVHSAWLQDVSLNKNVSRKHFLVDE